MLLGLNDFSQLFIVLLILTGLITLAIGRLIAHAEVLIINSNCLAWCVRGPE